MLSPARSRVATVLASILLPGALPAGAAPESIQIPLYHKIYTQKNGLPASKLGIRIGLGGGPKKLYEFDTGAPGFYAAYSPKWWPNYRLISSGTITQTYSSGNSYVANLVSTKLDFGHGVPKVRVQIAQVTSASGGSVDNWVADVAAGQPPLDQYFFGDFGSDLNTGEGLYGILPQLPGNLSSGFIVSTGGYDHPNPFLTIGLTSALRSQFPAVMQMHRDRGAGFFPGKSRPKRPLYQQEVINTRVTLQKSGDSAKFVTGVVLDTGAPSTTIRNVDGGFNISSNLLNAAGKGIISGAAFTMTRTKPHPVPPWILSFIVGNKTGFNEVDVSPKALPAHPVPYVNAGLNPFFRYDVMFDVENGEVAFRQITKGGPLIVIDGPSSGTTRQGQMLVRGVAVGRSQLLSRVEYRVGSGPYRPVMGLLDWRFTVELASGPNEITVRAVDIAGNEAREKIVLTVK